MEDLQALFIATIVQDGRKENAQGEPCGSLPRADSTARGQAVLYLGYYRLLKERVAMVPVFRLRVSPSLPSNVTNNSHPAPDPN